MFITRLKIHFNNCLFGNCVRLCFIFKYFYYHWNTTGMSHLKIINTSHVYVHKYENLKTKLCNCNANIYFSQQCLKYEMS